MSTFDRALDELKSLGFSYINTGGGCLALSSGYSGAEYILVTNDNLTHIEETDELISVGHYLEEDGDTVMQDIREYRTLSLAMPYIRKTLQTIKLTEAKTEDSNSGIIRAVLGDDAAWIIATNKRDDKE